MRYIYVIYNKEELKKIGLEIDDETIKRLLDPYSRVVELSEIVNRTVSLENAKAMMDCTSNHVFYNNALAKKNGSEYKNSDGRSFIRTLKGNFIMKGVPVLDIMLAIKTRNSVPSKLSNDNHQFQLEQETIKRLDVNLESLMNKHHLILEDLGKHIPAIVNNKRYEKAMEGPGVDVFVSSFRDVRYQLVKDESVNVDPGVEKITPNDIKLLKDLQSLMENLK
ncbi:MAG: hypothetical protein ACRCZ9_12510 [Fusobacteriaceae bacterium]